MKKSSVFSLTFLMLPLVLSGCFASPNTPSSPSDPSDPTDPTDPTDPVDPPEHVHTYSTAWSVSETHHWHDATCGHNVQSNYEQHSFSLKEEVLPTYSADGHRTYVCSVCEYEKNEALDKLIHNYSSEWSHDETHHWHDCLDEGYENEKGSYNTHTYSKEVTEPTENEGGYTTYTCITCGYSYEDDFTKSLNEQLLDHYVFALQSSEELGDRYYISKVIDGYQEEITLPSVYNGLPVTGFSQKEPFKTVSGVKTLIIPDSFTEMSTNELFSSIGGELEKIDLPFMTCSVGKMFGTKEKEDYIKASQVTALEKVTYGYTSVYTDFYIPQSLKTVIIRGGDIPSFAFAASLKLDYVELGDKVGKAENNSFYNASSVTIKKIAISKQVTNILNINSGLDKEWATVEKEGGLYIPDKDNNPVVYFGPSDRSCTEATIIEEATTVSSKYIKDYCFSLKTLNWNAANIESAYHFCKGTQIKTLNFLDSVKTIPGGIADSSNVESVSLGNSVETISTSAFYYCKIKTVNFPDSLKTIANSAFSGSPLNNAIKLNNGLESIGNAAFSSTKITSLVIPDSVTSIGDNILEGCSNLSSLTIPYLGGKPNDVASSTNYVTLARYFTKYQSADTSSSSMISIQIPDGKYIKIPSRLFTITVNSGEIYTNAFTNFSTITTLNFGAGVTKINSDVARNCNNLEHIKLSGSITEIDVNAFGQFDNLIDIVLDEENPNYVVEEGILFNKDMTTLIRCPARKNFSKYTIPSTVTKIENYAFSGNLNIDTIKNSSVKVIGDYAFLGSSLKSFDGFASVTSLGKACFKGTKIESVNLYSSSLTYISTESFDSCSKLTSVSFGLFKPKYIQSKAFYQCAALKSISNSSVIIQIGSYAFAGCTSLKSLSLTSDIESIGEYSLPLDTMELNEYGNGLYVGSSSTPYALFAKVIDNDASELVIHDDTVLIYPYWASNLNCTSLTIGKSIKRMDAVGSGQCTNLKTLNWNAINCRINQNLGNSELAFDAPVFDEINIGSEVVSLPRLFKQNNESVLEIDIPSNVKEIADNFLYYVKVKSVTLHEGLETVGENAFRGCTALASDKLPSTIKHVKQNAFTSSNILTTQKDYVIYLASETNNYFIAASLKTKTLSSYTLNENTEVVASKAFYEAQATSITLNEGLKYINYYAFYKCPVTSFVIPSTVIEIEAYAFSNIRIESVTFAGTIADWQLIEKADKWCINSSIKQVICSDGVITLE